ncbi:MAG: (d)CMP kinase [Clostridia bacterium]|nr:(d)CMP kinase [Clostridia bacterium]
MKKINIAIDGPAGAGKSTIAKRAASELGFIYVDTGALYRTVGVFAVEEGVDFDDLEKLEKLLERTDVKLKYENGVQKVYCNGEDYSGKIRTPEASLAASDISKIPMVRAFLLSLQRDIAKQNDCIMDGRDIGTVVLPDAQIKIFLTADVEKRAKRRYNELLEKGEKVDFDDVLEDMKKRDYQDSHREVAPLKPADDSVIVDTTDIGLEESIALMLRTIKERL